MVARALRSLVAVLALSAATGAAHADETLRWGPTAGVTPKRLVARREARLNGTLTVFGKEEPLRIFWTSEAEERELEGGKLALRFSRLVDENGDRGAEIAGKSFVVGHDAQAVHPDRKVADAGTVSAEVATAAIVEREISGTLAFQRGTLAMRAAVTAHDRRR